MDPQTVRQELSAREPLLHRREFVHDRASFDRFVAPDFWEVGASGQAHSRERVLDLLETRWASQAEDDFVTQGWTISDFNVRALGGASFLATYVIDQSGRRSRRVSVWQLVGADWQLVYHQGTPSPRT